MSDGIMLMIGEDGMAHRYDDTYDITVHCESQEDRDEAERRLRGMSWIPVTESLPEKYGWYLCTLKDGRVNCYYWDNKGKWLDNGKKHFFDLYEIRSRYTLKELTAEQEGSVYWTDWVIAWMPLPSPYREEGEQE